MQKSKSDVDGTDGRVVEVQVGKRWKGPKRERAFSVEDAGPFSLGSDRYGFFRHLQIQIICRFRFADISANADDLQIHAFIGRYGIKSADLRGYLQIFEDI